MKSLHISNVLTLRLRRFRIKLMHWEYWPLQVVYFIPAIYFLWLSIKARSALFFSASNPGLENGGMFHDSKFATYQLIPQKYYPITVLIKAGTHPQQAESIAVQSGITYPFIAKPDKGERGLGVKKINVKEELTSYLASVPVDVIIQQYVDLPLEFSVFYVRHPSKKNGVITSVTFKDLLTVRGDGQTDILGLVIQNDRAFLQLERLKKERNDLHHVLPEGEERILVPYGNHSRGTRFIDRCDLIDDQLTATFNLLSEQIAGFHYGRFDLRTATVNDLRQGTNMMVLELNGAKAEVAHIYHPGFSFFKAQGIIMAHFKTMWQIAMHNRHTSPFMSFWSFVNQWRQDSTHKKSITL